MSISAPFFCAAIWQPFLALCSRDIRFSSRESAACWLPKCSEARKTGTPVPITGKTVVVGRIDMAFRSATRLTRFLLNALPGGRYRPFIVKNFPHGLIILSSSKRDALDEALFVAAWEQGLDVNEPGTIQWAAARADIDGEALLAAAETEEPGAEARAALDEFDAHNCPGVPTVIVERERFFGKDRIDWIIEACRRHSG
jgi:2-hydroxychromene-2-carboxylate isomerase